jgi:signal transduction histidine kinase
MPAQRSLRAMRPHRKVDGRIARARVQSHFNATLRRSSGDKAPDLRLGLVVALTSAMFVISLASIEFTRNENLIPSLWPSNAILLVFLLRSACGSSDDGLVFLAGGTAIALANLAGGNSPALSAVLTVAHIVEVAAARVLLATYRDHDADLTSIRNLSIFMTLAGGLAPLAGASIGAAAVAAAHEIPWGPIWLSWYLSDVLGMIIVAPFLLSLKRENWRALRIKKRYVEAVGVLALIVAVAVVTSYYRFSLFVVAPVLLFTTFRFGVMGAAVGTLVFAFVATVFVVNGIGPAVLFWQSDPSMRIFALQLFTAATVFWSLPVAAVLAERDRLVADLSSANARLAVDGERKSQIVVGLHRRLVHAEERERLRLSHELHDQTGQSLTAAMLELRNIEPLVTKDGRNRLHALQKRMAEIGKTLHRVAWELRPASIDEVGLASALGNYISEWRAQYHIEIDFYRGGDPKLDELSDEVRTTIFRVAQEGLTNVAKHARGATSVSVVVEHVNAKIQLVIEDDGCGFNTCAAGEQADHRKGLGLVGMRERLLLLGGELEIESSVGAGTTIFARVPCNCERTTA